MYDNGISLDSMVTKNIIVCSTLLIFIRENVIICITIRIPFICLFVFFFQKSDIADYKCSLCCQTFTTQRSRTRHMNSIHNKSTAVACSSCSTVYSRLSALKRHQRSGKCGNIPDRQSLQYVSNVPWENRGLLRFFLQNKNVLV